MQQDSKTGHSVTQIGTAGAMQSPVLNNTQQVAIPEWWFRPITLGEGSGAKCVRWANVQYLTLGHFWDRLRQTQRSSVKDGPGYLQGELEGSQRLSAKMRTMSIVVLDLDHGQDPREIHNVAVRLGLACLIRPTFSSTGTRLKYRVIVPLAQDYVLPADPNGNAIATEWKLAYNALADMLGATDYDKSCRDLNRLFYFCRIPDVASPWILENPGRAISVAELLEHAVTIAPQDNSPKAKIRLDDIVDAPNATEDRKIFNAFYRRFRRHLNAARVLAEQGIDGEDKGEGRAEARCPFENGHSDPEAPGEPAYAFDAAVGEHGTAVFGCNHQHCQRDEYSGRECVDFAWALMRELPIDEWGRYLTDNVQTWFAKWHMALPAPELAIKEAVRSLTSESDDAAVAAAIKMLATGPKGSFRVTAVRDIAKRTSWNQPQIQAALKGDIERHEASTADLEAEDAQHRTPLTAKAERDPVPFGSAETIWSDWTDKEKCDHAYARLLVENRKHPKIFRREEGKACAELRPHGTRIKLVDVNTAIAWKNPLRRHMTFAAATQGTVKYPAPFKDVADYVATKAGAAPDVPIDDNSGAMLGDDGDGGLPFIKGIAHVPIFDKDGNLRLEEGYCPGGQFYLHPTISIPDVPEAPDANCVAAARSWIEEVFHDFPFSDRFDGEEPYPVREGVDERGYPLPHPARGYSSFCHAVCLILEPFVRHMIDGPCPGYHIDKPEQGTGAGLLADVPSYIFDGERIPVQTMTEERDNDVEFKKEVTATLLEGGNFIFFDNINHTVDSGVLAAALTAGIWKGRILGVSKNATIPIRSTWIFAGNNLKFSSEIASRRIIPIRLDAALENPADERPVTFWKYPDLPAFIVKNRSQIVWSCLVLIRNWIASGQRPWTGPSLASFTSWSHVMGSILRDCGYAIQRDDGTWAGFLENREAYASVKDEHKSDHKEFITLLWQKIGEERVTVQEAIERFDAFDLALLQSLGLETVPNDSHASAAALGTYISKKRLDGRTFNIGGDEGVCVKVTLVRKRSADGRTISFRRVVELKDEHRASDAA